jgi:hypothetical protein
LFTCDTISRDVEWRIRLLYREQRGADSIEVGFALVLVAFELVVIGDHRAPSSFDNENLDRFGEGATDSQSTNHRQRITCASAFARSIRAYAQGASKIFFTSLWILTFGFWRDFTPRGFVRSRIN